MSSKRFRTGARSRSQIQEAIVDEKLIARTEKRSND